MVFLGSSFFPLLLLFLLRKGGNGGFVSRLDLKLEGSLLTIIGNRMLPEELVVEKC